MNYYTWPRSEVSVRQGLCGVLIGSVSATVFLSAFGMVSFSAEAEVIAPPETIPFREALLEWSDSLKSFDGEYVATRPPLPAGWMSEPVSKRIVYRFCAAKDAWYMQRTDALKDGWGNTGTVDVYQNRIGDQGTTRREFDYNEDTGRDDYIFLRLNYPEDQLRGPPYITPDGLFSPVKLSVYGPGGSLSAFLNAGESVGYERNGHRILSHRTETGHFRMDFWFDGNDRIIRVEGGLGVMLSEGDIREIWEGDPYAAFVVYTAIEYGGYENINGVWFPMWAERTRFDYRPYGPEVKKVKKQQSANEITFSKMRFELAQHINEPREKREDQFQLIPEVSSLNVTIPLSPFEIEMPAGAHYSTPGTDEVFHYVPPWPWHERITWPMVGVIACLLVIGVGGGSSWWYARRRWRRRV